MFTSTGLLFIMVSNPLTLYKLIILYMLNQVSYPLTLSRICNFILEKEYTDYITFQNVCSQLADDKLILSEKTRNRTLLSITEEGKTSLQFFQSRISDSIKQDILDYLSEHNMELKNEVSVLSDYRKLPNGEYETHLWAKEKNEELLSIHLSVPTEELANTVCKNWQEKNIEIYQYLTSELL